MCLEDTPTLAGVCAQYFHCLVCLIVFSACNEWYKAKTPHPTPPPPALFFLQVWRSLLELEKTLKFLLLFVISLKQNNIILL